MPIPRWVSLLSISLPLLTGPAAAQTAKYWIKANLTGAMEPLASIHDILTADRVWEGGALLTSAPVPTPRFQELIVYTLPAPDSLVYSCKRVLGLPGDTLEMRAGQLLRNGRLVPEPYTQHTKASWLGEPADRTAMRTWQLPFYLGSDTLQYTPDLQSWGPLQVPGGHVAVLGDNRDESYDSRYIGFVPYRRLLGRLLRIWRPGSPDLLWVRDSTAP